MCLYDTIRYIAIMRSKADGRASLVQRTAPKRHQNEVDEEIKGADSIDQ